MILTEKRKERNWSTKTRPMNATGYHVHEPVCEISAQGLPNPCVCLWCSCS